MSRIKGNMLFKEIINLMFDEGYYYDTLKDIYVPRLSLNEAENSCIIDSIHNYQSCSDCDMAWDESWDFCSPIAPHHESEMEMMVWSSCFLDSDLFPEKVVLEEPDEDSNCFDVGYGPDEQNDNSNLLSDQCWQILSKPPSYYAICEERYQSPIQCSHVDPKCLPKKGFESFDSVESIMQLLEAMPSLKRGNMQSFEIPNPDLHPKGSLPYHSPSCNSSFHKRHIPIHLTQDGAPSMRFSGLRSVRDLGPSEFCMVDWRLDVGVRVPQLDFCVGLGPLVIGLLHGSGGLGACGGILGVVFDPGGSF